MDEGYICSVRDCDRAKFAKGYCQTHYKHVKAGKEPGPIAPRRGGLPAARPCGYEPCDRPARAKGYCQVHYYQERRNGVMRDILPPGQRRPCSVEGCGEPFMARGWCARHYREFWARYAKYGLTAESFLAMLERQGEACAICRDPVPQSGWHVDHDHACCPGQTSCGACVRGLLCGPCNVGIGMLRDDPKILQAANEYLAGA